MKKFLAKVLAVAISVAAVYSVMPVMTYSDAEQSATDGLDFSAARLIVMGADEAFAGSCISTYNGVSLYQFASEDDARQAYLYFSTHASFVAADTQMTVADDNDIYLDAPDFMTEDDNPLDRITGQAGAGYNYDIALIDTGAPATEAVSMISEYAGDENGHGTRMLDAIRSQTPDARVLSIKAFDASGIGDVSAVYAAFEYAINAGVKVINFSASAWATEENAIIADEIHKAIAEGITVVGAAGNNGLDASLFIPGGISDAYIIGAAYENGERLDLSNFGETVDYNVIAESTSYAAAIFSGFIAANSLNGISEILNKDMIYESGYVAENEMEMPEDGSVTEEKVAAGTWDTVFADRTHDSEFSVADAHGTGTTDCSALSEQYRDDEYPNGRENYFYSVTVNGVTYETFCLEAQTLFVPGEAIIYDWYDFLDRAAIDKIATGFYYVDTQCSYLTETERIMIKQCLTWYYSPFSTFATWPMDEVLNTTYLNGIDYVENFSAGGTYPVTGTGFVYVYGETQKTIWVAYTVNGQVKLQKYGSDSPSDWSVLYGAVFQVRDADNNWVGAFATGAGGKGYTLGLISDGAHPASNTGYADKSDFPIADSLKNEWGWTYNDHLLVAPGTYYVSEIAAPVSGLYDMDAVTKEIHVPEGGEATAEFNDTAVPPKTVQVTVCKTTSDAGCTAQITGNSLYSQDFSGAQFRVTYTNAAGNTVTETKTTGTDGSFAVNNVLNGTTFTAVETKAPKGYALPANKTQETTVDMNNAGTLTLTFSDMPLFDPIGVLVQKVIETGTDKRTCYGEDHEQ